MTAEHNQAPTQAANLEINEVADGLVVFDPAVQQVHYLNNTASIVFELCDGATSPEQMVALAAEAAPSDAWPDVFDGCLSDLRRQKLVH